MAIIKPNKIDPNKGVSPQHGSDTHNEAIDDKVAEMEKEDYKDIRKNQQQVDKDGNVVGLNRPDVQGDKDDKHYNIEFDFAPKRSEEHGQTIRANDPDSIVELHILKKK
jgi:hypothetical protein